MTQTVRRVSWDAFIASLITASLMIAVWIFSGGRLAGETSKDIENQRHEIDALKSEYSLTQREIQKMLAGQEEINRKLDVIQAEQRILHREQLGRLNGGLR